MSEPREIKFVDLFCGLGAFHAAFNRVNSIQHETKYKCVMACDIDEGVRKIYQENYGLMPEGDINELNTDSIPDFDVLCAGFPCQPFSIAGNKKGFEDETRGNLFYSILKIVDKKHPTTLLLENVKNLHTIHNGDTFRVITEELEKRGYYVSHRVIDSRYYGSPQSRQRIYIVCTKNKPYVFRDVTMPIVPVSSVIDYTLTKFFDYEPKYRLEPCHKPSMMSHKLINNETGKGGRQGERVYRLDTCGPTICATSGGPGAKTGLYDFGDGKIRTLTVPETLGMFGFDPGFKHDSLSNKNNMLFYLGNSIVVNVVEQIIKDLTP